MLIMISPLLEIFVQYSGAIVVGIIVALVCKAYLAYQMQGKIQGYQGEIVKSHSRILRLESENDTLKKQLKDLQGRFSKDHIFMN